MVEILAMRQIKTFYDKRKEREYEAFQAKLNASNNKL